MSNTKELLKKFYIEHKKSVKETYLAVGVTRETFYHHKRADKREGTDWDKLKLANQQSKEDLDGKEEFFLSKLIEAFDKVIEKLEELEPQKAIEILAKYSDTYYKIKHPVNKNCKKEKIAGAVEAIKIIKDIAIEKNNTKVINILHEYKDRIITQISKIK